MQDRNGDPVACEEAPADTGTKEALSQCRSGTGCSMHDCGQSWVIEKLVAADKEVIKNEVGPNFVHLRELQQLKLEKRSQIVQSCSNGY